MAAAGDYKSLNEKILDVIEKLRVPEEFLGITKGDSPYAARKIGGLGQEWWSKVAVELGPEFNGESVNEKFRNLGATIKAQETKLCIGVKIKPHYLREKFLKVASVWIFDSSGQKRLVRPERGLKVVFMKNVDEVEEYDEGLKGAEAEGTKNEVEEIRGAERSVGTVEDGNDGNVGFEGAAEAEGGGFFCDKENVEVACGEGWDDLLGVGGSDALQDDQLVPGFSPRATKKLSFDEDF